MNMTGLSNKTYDKAPGNILQEMYLKRRFKKILQDNQDSKVSFIEIGSGSGNISRILLDLGLNGIGFELNKEACRINHLKNEKFIKSEKYKIFNDNYFNCVGGGGIS
jgi:16S rRNA A1518/A1519 N6-dimethyltransferase RsmA/KsgA/DIM1 with predicted DNA glycosylase/AP lyase activity